MIRWVSLGLLCADNSQSELSPMAFSGLPRQVASVEGKISRRAESATIGSDAWLAAGALVSTTNRGTRCR